MLPLVTSPWIEGLASVQDRNLGRNGIDIGVLKDTIPLPLISDKVVDFLALVKTGNEKVKRALAGGYLTSNMKDANPEQYDGVVVISEVASQIAEGTN